MVKDAEKKNGFKAGQIVSTDPAPGTKLSAGDKITLYIVSTDITYPDFTNGEYSLTDIQKFCKENSVNLEDVYVPNAEYEPGTIYSQSIKEGTFVMAGQTLQIFIAEEEESGEYDDDMSAEEIDGIGNEDQITTEE